MEEQIKEDIEIAVEKKTRGGARPGAGRKKIYDSKYDFTRLKCKRNLAAFARTCISILASLPERHLNDISAGKLDGSNYNLKGASGKLWSDADCLESDWNIRIDGKYDNRLFALAYIQLRPDHVRFSYFVDYGKVRLCWQFPSEVAQLMMVYGNLLARKNHLKGSEQELLDKIPNCDNEILKYIEEQLDQE